MNYDKNKTIRIREIRKMFEIKFIQNAFKIR